MSIFSVSHYFCLLALLVHLSLLTYIAAL